MHGAGDLAPITLEITRKLYRRPGREPVEAVRDLRITVHPGETLCLIGPSGAGKTTTLRMLTGLDQDFEGQVRPDPRTLRIGIVFQEPRLLPWRTVEDNVRLALPRRDRERPLNELFADLGLAAWRTSYPGELSGGMQRRVALARALAVEPHLLVLDEPFISLDDLAAAALRQIVFGIVAARRLSVLMVTHNIGEALSLAHRLLLVSERPATLLAEVSLPEPVESRTPLWIAAQRMDLATRYPKVIAS